MKTWERNITRNNVWELKIKFFSPKKPIFEILKMVIVFIKMSKRSDIKFDDKIFGIGYRGYYL